jgi:type IV pilus assembly protein PilW
MIYSHQYAYCPHSMQIKKSVSFSRGFGLVELMVGLVIGLLATLVIMQVFSLFEGQKRTTSSTSDAQTSGSVALYSIQRDIQLAGFGLPLSFTDPDYPPLRCLVTPTVDHDGDAGTPQISLNPIDIVDGAAPTDSDTITVRFGGTASGGVPVKVQTLAGANVGVQTSLGCKVNDVAYIVMGQDCRATRVNAIDVASVPNHLVTVDDATGIVARPLPPALGDSSDFSCLGDWNEYTFSVNMDAGTNQGQLMRQTGSDAAPAAIVSGVVNVQAQYGISSSPETNEITRWVDATGAWVAPGNTSAVCDAATANRNCIKAVRIAVVTRSELLEKEPVPGSAVCSSLTDANPTGICAWDATSADPNGVGWPAPAIDLSNTADWNRYRYRVFETIIPLRNIVWTRARL